MMIDEVTAQKTPEPSLEDLLKAIRDLSARLEKDKETLSALKKKVQQKIGKL